MEVLDNTSESFVSRKRPLDDADDCELEDFGEPRTAVSKFPPPKIRTGVQVVRDFPPGCGIKLERRPLENLDNKNLCENMTFNGIKKLKDSTPFENFEHKCYNPKKHEQNKSMFCSRPSGKVKRLELPCSKEGYNSKPKVTTTVVTSMRKALINSDIKLEKITSNGNSKLMDARSPEINKLKNFTPNEIYERLFGELLDANSSIMAVEPFVDRKRLLDDTNNDCENDDFSKDAYGHKQKVMTTFILPSKPLMSLDNLGMNLGKMDSHGQNKSLESQQGENNKFKKFEPKEKVRNKPYFASRPPGKVKHWDPTSSKEAITIVSREEVVQRKKIKEAVYIFNEFYRQKLLEEKEILNLTEDKFAHWRIALEVAKMVKQKLKWMDPEKVLGPICGVQIGDKFRFREQLHMIGLHCQHVSGIDYTKINGKNLAISIVDSHRYPNDRGLSDMLIYSGHGGLRFWGKQIPVDQKLERGNLALKNSMDEKTPIRVIRKVEVVGKNEVFLYDGLYIVNHYAQKRNAGKTVFQFQLNRLPGQPQSSLNFQC